MVTRDDESTIPLLNDNPPTEPIDTHHHSTIDINTSPGTTCTQNIQHDTSTKSTVENDDERYCRICGEGEEDEDDSINEYDEESLLNDPMLPNSTMITQQEPPYTQMMTRYRSNSQRPTTRSNTKKWIKQSNPLIRPCRCKGTMMYVHVSCLNRWRMLSPRASSYVACDLCGYEYNIYRPKYAACLTNVHFLRLMTALLVIVLIVVCAYLAKIIDVYLLGHLPQSDDDDWLELHGPTWLWMDRVYLFAGLVVVSLVGMVYLVYLCATHPDHLINPSVGQTNGGCLCCDQSSCPWYSCYLADFAACSGDAAAGGFLIFVIMVSLMAILFGVLGAVTGVFRLMESWVDKVAGHLKEKILDVD